MTDDQIKYMVNRFLQWRLPENFNPDAGISFKRDYNEHTTWPMKHEPVGTNLFDATQAEEMVRYLVDGMPVPKKHVAVISPPEAQEILADPKATKEEIERAHGMTYEIPCEHAPAETGVKIEITQRLAREHEKVAIYHSAMTGRWYVGFGRNKDGSVRRKHDVTEQMEAIIKQGIVSMLPYAEESDR